MSVPFTHGASWENLHFGTHVEVREVLPTLIWALTCVGVHPTLWLFQHWNVREEWQEISTLENEVNMSSWNSRNQLTNGAASHPRRTETLSILLQMAEILHSSSVSVALKYFIFFIDVLLPCFSSVSHGFYLISMSVCHFLQSLSLNRKSHNTCSGSGGILNF